MIKKAATMAALFFALTCTVSAEERPLQNTPIQILQEGGQEQAILTDFQTIEGKQTKTIIKTYEVPPEFDPSLLDEGPFQDQDYQYDAGMILRISENSQSESKLASQTVTISHENREGGPARFAPFLDYDDGEYQGQLILDKESIYTEAAGRTGYSYPVREVREFLGLIRNDTYAIPKTAQKNGVVLSLADISWTNLGDSYTATAIYTGTGYGSKATGYTSTGTYLGTVERDVLKSVTYRVIYEGVPILSPFVAPVLLWIGGGALLLLLIFGGVVWRLRPNAKLHAMTPEGRYKVIRRYRMDYTDPLVDLGSPFVRQYQDFLITVDNSAARKLSGAMIRVLLGGNDHVEHRLLGKGKANRQKSSIHAGLRRDGSQKLTSQKTDYCTITYRF